MYIKQCGFVIWKRIERPTCALNENEKKALTLPYEANVIMCKTMNQHRKLCNNFYILILSLLCFIERQKSIK